MLFGMTRGEIGLVIFIFALVLGAGILPRLGERAGAWLSRKRNG
jgi:Sec-independent protein translocase protein TatA